MSNTAAQLERQGFTEGIRDALETPSGEVLSTAIVFRSARAAARQTAGGSAEYRRLFGSAGVTRMSVSAIPGAQGLIVPSRAPRDASALSFVLFSVGRCAIVESVVYVGSRVNESVTDGATAGAVALYQRAKAICTSSTPPDNARK